MNDLWRVGWSWYPSVILGFGLWTLLYQWVLHRRRPTPWRKQIAFHSGTLAGLLALVSPLDKLSDNYLFSAHMIQHLLLMFVAAPLWLVGTPGWLINKIFPKGLGKPLNALASPISTFGFFVGVLWFWHIPFFYEIAQENEAIHIFEHLSFMGAALIGWWPVWGAESAQISKPEPPVRMLYLFLLSIPCTCLAAVLTFAHSPLYPAYISAPHIFGLDALQDQHLGGLLMWMPTHLIILLMLGWSFFRWFDDSNRNFVWEFETQKRERKAAIQAGVKHEQ